MESAIMSYKVQRYLLIEELGSERKERTEPTRRNQKP